MGWAIILFVSLLAALLSVSCTTPTRGPRTTAMAPLGPSASAETLPPTDTPVGVLSHPTPTPQPKEAQMDRQLRITVIYDNNHYEPGYGTDWGFACVVEGLEQTILFDTGARGDLLLSNMAKAGIDPEEIDICVISHTHGDHTGGLRQFAARNPQITLYVPGSHVDSFRKAFGASVSRIIGVGEARPICKGAYTTGELGGNIKEQSLVLDSERGLILITGCAHPGIVHITEFVKEHFQRDILAVLGGFHLGQHSQRSIRRIVGDMQALGVACTGPCHCSGTMARALFAEAYGDHYLEIGAGRVVDVQSLP